MADASGTGSRHERAELGSSRATKVTVCPVREGQGEKVACPWSPGHDSSWGCDSRVTLGAAEGTATSTRP